MKGRGIIAIGIIAMFIMTSGMASAASSLGLDTNKSAYNIGEDVIITVTNTGDGEASFPYGFTVADETGKVIYHPPILFFTPPLAPGASYSYTWDQICDDKNQALPGDYTIQTSWASATIKLFDSSSSGKGGRSPITLPVPVSSGTLV